MRPFWSGCLHGRYPTFAGKLSWPNPSSFSTSLMYRSSASAACLRLKSKRINSIRYWESHFLSLFISNVHACTLCIKWSFTYQWLLCSSATFWVHSSSTSSPFGQFWRKKKERMWRRMIDDVGYKDKNITVKQFCLCQSFGIQQIFIFSDVCSCSLFVSFQPVNQVCSGRRYHRWQKNACLQAQTETQTHTHRVNVEHLPLGRVRTPWGSPGTWTEWSLQSQLEKKK